MPGGKAAGEPCANLAPDLSCRIWETEAYPPWCRDFAPCEDHCGASREEALDILGDLENKTAP